MDGETCLKLNDGSPTTLGNGKRFSSPRPFGLRRSRGKLQPANGVPPRPSVGHLNRREPLKSPVRSSAVGTTLVSRFSARLAMNSVLAKKNRLLRSLLNTPGMLIGPPSEKPNWL